MVTASPFDMFTLALSIKQGVEPAVAGPFPEGGAGVGAGMLPNMKVAVGARALWFAKSAKGAKQAYLCPPLSTKQKLLELTIMHAA
jgi:hypothetical protein